MIVILCIARPFSCCGVGLNRNCSMTMNTLDCMLCYTHHASHLVSLFLFLFALRQLIARMIFIVPRMGNRAEQARAPKVQDIIYTPFLCLLLSAAVCLPPSQQFAKWDVLVTVFNVFVHSVIS